MRPLLGICTLLMSTLVSVLPVRSDWLEDAASEKFLARYGHPAITLNAETGVTIVLPDVSIDDARAAGLTPRQAAMAFLSRYGPQICSGIIDLNEPRPALRIKLIVQYERSFLDASVNTQRGVKDAIAAIESNPRHSPEPTDSIFEIMPDGEAWVADYVPSHPVKCTNPPDDGVVDAADPNR